MKPARPQIVVLLLCLPTVLTLSGPLRAEDAPPAAADPALATTHYAEAFAQFPAWPDETTESRAFQITRSGWGRSAGDLEDLITRTQPVIDAVIKGSQCPAGAFPESAQRPTDDTPRPFDLSSRRIATLLLMHVHHHAYVARNADAGRVAVATLCYAADLARGGGLAGKAMEAEIRLSVLRALQMTLQIAMPDDPFWADFPPGWRAALDRTPPFAAALEEEAKVDPASRRVEVLCPPSRWDTDSFIGEVFQQVGALPPSERAAMADGVVTQIANLLVFAQDAWKNHDPMVLNNAAAKVLRPETIEKGTLAQGFAACHLARYGQRYRSILAAEAQAQALRVQMALKRYRIDKGEWPASLAALQPAYLKTIPEDPFDGKPLRYVLKPEGAFLYSVGPNGVDDEGGKAYVEGEDFRGTDLFFRVFE